MFIFTVKIKWWRVVSFLLLTVILAAGFYYVLTRDTPKMLPASPPKEQEGQVWQV